MIGLQCGTGSLPSGENGGSLWRDVQGMVKRRLNYTENKNLVEKMIKREDGCWKRVWRWGKGWPNTLPKPQPGVLVAEQRRWCPGSNSVGSQKETDIAVCSQGMWSCPSPVYKDWAVAPDLLSCTRLCVSLTKRITPMRSFRRLVLPTHGLRGSAIVYDYFPQNVRCALDMLLKVAEMENNRKTLKKCL